MNQPPDHVMARSRSICPSDADRPNGEQYTPSNGTEGEIFMSRWCEACHHDRNEDCEILMQALCHEEPTEWQYWNGKPVCTSFEAKREPAERKHVDPIAPGQIALDL
jgi:hypothetical protein